MGITFAYVTLLHSRFGILLALLTKNLLIPGTFCATISSVWFAVALVTGFCACQCIPWNSISARGQYKIWIWYNLCQGISVTTVRLIVRPWSPISPRCVKADSAQQISLQCKKWVGYQSHQLQLYGILTGNVFSLRNTFLYNFCVLTGFSQNLGLLLQRWVVWMVTQFC